MLRGIKALLQLGPRQIFWYAVYQAGLRSRWWRRLTPLRGASPLSQGEARLKQGASPLQQGASPLNRGASPLLPLPSRAALTGTLDISARVRLMSEAEEICAGQVRLFGGPPTALELEPRGPAAHWTDYERGRAAWGVEDVKYLWEPARFGWAFTLGRAALLSGDERFAAAFWRGFERFERAQAPNQGPNWTSGQEVALRMVALLFAGGAFAGSAESTSERRARLDAFIAEHARRIPPTLSYARAQHNNHLVSEALGLYAAGVCLPDLEEAPGWREQGWKEFNGALQDQIQADGTYAQHSTSYHRLMLHAALLADSLARRDMSAGENGREWPAATRALLGAAVDWLEERLDPLSGRASNLGANDGANILPLAPGEIHDYRAALQAASRAFRGRPALPPGPWDELGLWLGIEPTPLPPSGGGGEEKIAISRLPAAKPRERIMKSDRSGGWAGMRAVHFSSRPSHADQLQVDIRAGGEPLALDAGSYSYNAPAPWNNGLASARVHNTVTVNRAEPMTRAGTFLWLDWDQAEVLGRAAGQISAERNGYRRLGLVHRRALRETAAGWLILDDLLPARSRPGAVAFKLHWLLPDWPYKIDGRVISLARPGEKALRFSLALEAEGEEGQGPVLQVIRAGQSLLGPPEHNPLLGWVSPTYGLRLPALSVTLILNAKPPVTFRSEFIIQGI